MELKGEHQLEKYQICLYGKKIVMCVLVLVKIRGLVLHFYYPCAKLAVVCRSDVTGGQVRLQCSLNNIKINPPIIEMMSAVVSY